MPLIYRRLQCILQYNNQLKSYAKRVPVHCFKFDKMIKIYFFKLANAWAIVPLGAVVFFA